MKQDSFYTNLITSTDRQLLDAYSTTVTGVVKNVAQAVVHIKVIKRVKHPQTKKIIEQPGSGSGFVISTDGYIVTNNQHHPHFFPQISAYLIVFFHFKSGHFYIWKHAPDPTTSTPSTFL